MGHIQNIALGTAAIGRPLYINIKQQDTEIFDRIKFKQSSIEVLEAAYQNGIRYFDTSPGYGIAEQILIEWLKDKKDRSIEVATKWGYSYVANFDPKATLHEIKDHSLSQLLKQWETSQQLIPYLSTYQIHSATLDTGVLKNREVLEKLAEIKADNRLKIGLTTTGNNQVEVIRKAMEISVDQSQLFDSFQVTYNILDQSLLDVADFMIASGKRIIIKEALANGRIFKNKNYPEYSHLYQTLEQMAKKYEVGVDAVALRFCVDSIRPFLVLSGASEEVQIKENLKSNRIKLEEEDINILKDFKITPDSYWSERKQLRWN